MFFDQNNEQKLDDLILENERLNTLVGDLFEINSDLMVNFLSSPTNFTQKNWDEIQKLKKKLDQDLKTRLENVPNPKKVKEARASLNPAAHWLYVR